MLSFERRKAEKRRVREKEKGKESLQVGEKFKKVTKHYVFPMICGSGGSRSRLSKAVRSHPAK